MKSHVRILGIAGSLRRGSYNQAALRATKLLLPENSEIDLFRLDDIPIFKEDVFDENGNLLHEPTKQLIQELLKNLADWTRRISPALAREASP
jgi:NAD(P)H-dependent FMN reductase